MSEIYHAWYSEKAADLHGSSIYAREDGTEVEVTAVNKNIGYADSYKWDDKVYVGKVVRYVREGGQQNGLTVIKKFSFRTVDKSRPIRRILS